MASVWPWPVALVGLEGRMVEVEADIGAGLPRTVLVGLPDSALYQSRDRCKAAVSNSGQTWPMSLLTINLSPATLPKAGQPLRPVRTAHRFVDGAGFGVPPLPVFGDPAYRRCHHFQGGVIMRRLRCLVAGHQWRTEENLSTQGTDSECLRCGAHRSTFPGDPNFRPRTPPGPGDDGKGLPING